MDKLIPAAYAQCQPASAPSNLSPTGTIPPGLTTFTWTGSPGAQYDFRLNDGTASWQAVCNGQVQSNRSLCTDNLQTNSVQVNLQPGVLQGWWVHAHNACSYTPAVGAQITVSAAQTPSPTPSSSPTASPTSSPTVSPSSSPTSSPSPTPTTQSAFYLYPPTTQTVATTTCATADLRQTTIPWDSVTDSGGNHNYSKTLTKSQLDSTYPLWVIGAGLNGNKDQPATVTIAGQTYTISASSWSSHDDTYLEFYYTGAFRKIHGVTADNFAVTGTGTIAVPGTITITGSSLSSYSGGSVPPNTGVDIKYCGAAQPNPQCSDTTDNDGDGKIDSSDPGCHSDGNPDNPDSYVPSDDDETDEAQTECSDNADNDDDSLIDEDDPGCHDDGNAGNPSSYNPDDDDETNEIPSFTVEYRIAETEAGLNDVEFADYDEEPIFTNFELSDPTPGDKFIWVEFKASDGRTEIRHIRIRLVGDPPEIKGVVCNLDIARENVKITVEGKNLGTDQGKVTADGKDTEILEWTNDLVTALMNKPNISNDQTNRFKIAISGSDGTLIKEVPCEIDTALIYLGARLFCREPGKFDVEGVKVRILDSIKTSVEETVSIDKEGVVKGLQTRLQAGSRYALSIKAPYSLRRNTYFTASAGTTVVESDTGGDFILPVGDIAPKVRVDGFINSLDRSELSTQWRVLGTQTTVRTGDFNRDTKVNSVDWACMRFDFNQSDADLPTEVPAEDNPEATPAPTSAPTPTVTPTSTASSTAPPSTLPADEDEDTPPPASPTPTASTSPTP